MTLIHLPKPGSAHGHANGACMLYNIDNASCSAYIARLQCIAIWPQNHNCKYRHFAMRLWLMLMAAAWGQRVSYASKASKCPAIPSAECLGALLANQANWLPRAGQGGTLRDLL